MNDIIWHASPVEVVWLLVVALGLYLSHLNGIEALRDWQALHGISNGRRAIAVGNLRREIVRGLIHFAWLMLGLIAAAIPTRGEITTSGLIVQVVLVLSAAGMTMNSYLDRRDRMYLLTHGMQPRDDLGRFTK